MNYKNTLPVICLALSAQACTRDYAPKASATGGQIFQAACAECHTADNKDAPGMLFTLHSKNANPIYIAHKVHSGSIRMPKFPNIKGNKMRALSEYVLDHSLTASLTLICPVDFSSA